MLSFLNDYSEGAHARILKALEATNLEQTCGYGLDQYCRDAGDLIGSRRSLCRRRYAGKSVGNPRAAPFL